jgi:hypothetical protein
MGKGVGSHDGLVGLDDHAGDLRDEPARGEEVLGNDPRMKPEQIVPGPDGHDHLFE